MTSGHSRRKAPRSETTLAVAPAPPRALHGVLTRLNTQMIGHQFLLPEARS